MSNLSRPKDRRWSLIVVVVVFILSLIGAVVLFYVLDSAAQIQNKYISLGGAIAGFVVIFIILRGTYYKLTSTETQFEKISDNEKMRSLENQIKQLLISKFNNFNIPEGYTDEISREFRFAFCYPKDWEFSKLSGLTLYGGAVDKQSGSNVNVAISEIGPEVELDKLYKDNLELERNLFPKAEVVFIDKCLFQGLPAYKQLLNYEDNTGLKMSLYQILVANKDKDYLYVISFTTSQKEFESMRGLFENIASTFRIL